MAYCPDCGGDTKLIGPIPATDTFAGKELDQILSGGYLYQCHQCTLGFRWPRLSKNQLDALYTQGNDLAWASPVDTRQDWHMGQKWIKQNIRHNSMILDIGCFEGGFLEPLVDTYHCSGIEIHPAASERAKQKGISIIGSDFSVIPDTFDCITSFDVIEHIEKPRSFLNNCLSAVKPGGWILISTGNLDSFTFKLSGSRYWYCTIAEHISFVSPSWFHSLSSTLDYTIINQANFSHSNSSWGQRLKETSKNILYHIAPFLSRTLRKHGMGGKNIETYPELADYPPSWGSAHDHFMVFLQKR